MFYSILIDQARNNNSDFELRQQIEILQEQKAEAVQLAERESSKFAELNNRYKLQELLLEDMERKWAGENQALEKQLKSKTAHFESLMNDVSGLKADGGNLDQANALLLKQLEITRSSLAGIQDEYNKINTLKLQQELKVSQLEKSLALANEQIIELQKVSKQTQKFVNQSDEENVNISKDREAYQSKCHNLQSRCDDLETRLR